MRNSSQQTADDNCHFLSVYYGFLFIFQDSIAIAFFFCGFQRFFESQSTFGDSLNSGVK
ncbi:hypothetical protein [Salmonella enterica subsp. enterica serovar Bredeney]|uniref:Uncharacterized protein n=1 Tax=Salmonella schwarzengrund (strain CVM19633) TaxID=439843 RepID=A0A0N1QS08_SALSV|nr:hypothetical protein SeSA_A3858 [Salmonella enterica subsp. enterica serovar Schwarzengrund str. CVM19633]EDY30712.1 hypothetical protein SeSB_A3992 [Salmonella enterica subsp. enterica serovar Schwarzengrund str. SL480]CAI3053644.1 hypothetical protein [Salmonella enterica subsp. enterica serovar Bredeney]